jgi:hypothetical protein
MPKKDLQDPGSLLEDILEVSWPLAVGVILGLIGGIAAFVWFSTSTGLVGRISVLILLVALVVGAFAGLIIGVLLDSLVNLIRGKSDDDEPPRRRLPRRRDF